VAAARDITVSVVSHGQNALVNQLLRDLGAHSPERVSLVLTENIPDATPLDTASLSCPVERIANPSVKGFGANHNAAFERCRTPWFCVLNPDIRFSADPFPPLLDALAGPRAAIAGPLVRNPTGGVEDSARRFPTAGSLLRKLFSDRREPDYPTDRGTQDVDWVAGMFMLCRADAYRAVRGFDEAYFLYYEDVDLCRRLRATGNSVRYVPGAEVVHDARRASRRRLAPMLHHLRSALRFLASG
jgi:GT2 family glycosyltransferase